MWTAYFSDNTTIERDGHIFHSIKHKLIMLMHLSYTCNGHKYTANFLTGVLSVDGQPLDVYPIRSYHNIGPICFHRWESHLDTEQGRKMNMDRLSMTGLGWQGNGPKNRNIKRYIAIYPDGTHELIT